jgi:hypothetical protein
VESSTLWEGIVERLEKNLGGNLEWEACHRVENSVENSIELALSKYFIVFKLPQQPFLQINLGLEIANARAKLVSLGRHLGSFSASQVHIRRDTKTWHIIYR